MTGAFKVCRVDSVAGAALAAAAGARFVGLHALNRHRFTDARRTVFTRVVQRLTSTACDPVILFNEPDEAFINATCTQVGLSALQLHAIDADPNLARNLQRTFAARGETPRIVKTYAAKREGVALSRLDVLHEVEAWRPYVAGVLVDADARGGTGTVVDWSFARSLIRYAAVELSFVAGGIGPLNVANALRETGASAADMQSSLELDRPNGRYRKDVKQIIAAAAAIEGTSYQEKWRSYRAARAKPRVLFSPTDLSANALVLLGSMADEDVDGIQVDVTDGTAGVPADAWPKSAQQWAIEVQSATPELPLWIHFFSSDAARIARDCLSAQEENPHLVGAFVQAGRPDLTVNLCETLRSGSTITFVPSITSSAAECLDDNTIAASPVWQITTAAETVGRAVRAAAAVHRLRAGGVRVQLDRAVTADLLLDMPVRPDGITIGRGWTGDQAMADLRLLLNR